MKYEKNKKDSQAQQFQKIQCHYHPNEFLKYFCKKQQCIQPLCKICLDIHIDEHDVKGDTKDVVFYEKCQTEVIKKMTEDMNKFQEQIQALSNKIDRIINFQCEQNWMSLIEQAEKQVLGVVESYFSNLRSYLFSSQPQLQKLQVAQTKLDQFTLRLTQLQEEITNIYMEKSVQQLIFYYQGDVERVNNNYRAKLDDVLEELSNIDFHEINLPKFMIDPNKINDLIAVLYEYAQFETQRSENNDQQQNEAVYEQEIENKINEPQYEEEVEEQDVEIQEDYNEESNY